jgi:hypothetical protein
VAGIADVSSSVASSPNRNPAANAGF